MPSDLPDNNYAYYSKDKTTIILSTGECKIDDKFNFRTETCLVYAEKILISPKTKIKCPGKNIGLFCHTLAIPEPVSIDVSGEKGNAGTNDINHDGGRGENGRNSGNVWVCVQSLPKTNPFRNLEIKAYGGEGGRGGDSRASKKSEDGEKDDKQVETKGGDGGNGGNGGDIELLFGTPEMDAHLAVIDIDQRSWPEQVMCLTEQVISDSLPGYLSDQDNQLLKLLKGLADVLQALASQLEILSGLGDSKVQNAASSLRQELCTNLATKKKAPMNVTTTTIDHLNHVLEDVRSLNNKQTGLDTSRTLAEVEKAIATVAPREGSELVSLEDDLERDLRASLYRIKRSFHDFTNQNLPGSGGFGGDGPRHGVAGIDGQKEGQSRGINLHFNGTKTDTDVLQTYIFPEQCQMLLNKADEFFFSSDTKQWKSASELYDTLLGRLRILDAFNDNKNIDSGLYKALKYLETGLNITNNPIPQLRSVYEQANSRRNRLLLGQDMFGHVDSWVPRLSFGFYAQSVKDRVTVLESAERLTSDYEKAFQNHNDVQTIVDQGIAKMADVQKAAEAKIDLLTSPNGPLVTGVYKITFLTTEIKVKRQRVKDKLAKIQFHDKVDCSVIVDGLCTMATASFDRSSIVGLFKKGFEIYQKMTDQATNAENIQGDAVKKEFIIDQLAECGDTLESLEKALKTKKNHEIDIDDPGALKVISTKDAIKKILREFKNSIADKDRKDMEGDLDDYVAVTLNRNNAILDYNASLQLLFEACQAREYSKTQGESMAQRRLTLDPNTPAILFWLRKTRDSMRLELMQLLNYESRAIQFWGLQTKVEYSSPGPLQSVLQLQDGQLKLNKAFANSLNGYANSIRVTWPRETNNKGLFYQLTNTELEALKQRQTVTTSTGTKGVYSTSIRLKPGALPFGTGRADVRINQVRLWLLGVKVAEDNAQRKRLMVNIAHTGNETLEDATRQKLEFSHDAVNIQFEYDTARVQKTDDFNTNVVFSKQGIESNWSGGDTQPTASTFAAIGPFTMWRFSIRESENPGLDMGSVTGAYVEFRGANRPFSVDYRKV